MSNAEWMKGLRPRLRADCFPVPPIPVDLVMEKEFDQAKAARLESDMEAAIDAAEDADGLDWLRVKALDAMTANRLAAEQAFRLVVRVLRRLDGSVHVAGRITPAGDVVELLPAGRAEGGA